MLNLFLFLLAGLLVSVFSLWLFVEIAEETFLEQNFVILDRIILEFIHSFANPVMDKIMTGITYMGSFTAYLIILPLASGFLLYKRRYWEAGMLIVCLLGATVLNLELKAFFQRTRPNLFMVIEQGYSFPSGHAMVSLCFYGMLAYLFWQSASSWFWRISAVMVTAVFVMLIGFSRMYLGVHWPTDVIAGFAAALFWLSICVLVFEGIRRYYLLRHT